MTTSTHYLNLGCGSRFHPDWINMDVAPSDPSVIRADLSKGIPLPDAHCAVVYHAAVLEHFRQEHALGFLKECARVLAPGGVIRVGVPDLERQCQLYLKRLQRAAAGEVTAAHDYDWLLLELFDQIVRERSGGAMVEWLRQDPLPNEAFVYERIGEEGRALLRGLRTRGQPAAGARRVTLSRLVGALRRRARGLPAMLRKPLQAILLDRQDRRALAIGRFRLGGEVHQWMYDRFSLARLLRQAGFSDPQVQDAATSQVPDWDRFHLDRRPDGTVLKPDLLFMEAVKSPSLG